MQDLEAKKKLYLSNIKFVLLINALSIPFIIWVGRYEYSRLAEIENNGGTLHNIEILGYFLFGKYFGLLFIWIGLGLIPVAVLGVIVNVFRYLRLKSKAG